MDTKPPKRPQGFAALSPERRREIASKGGKSVSPDKRSFSTHAGLAEAAGTLGGHASKGSPRKPRTPK